MTASASEAPKVVGFLGLGIMGNGMVRRLLNEAGTNVVVWNRSKAKCEQLAKEFGSDRVAVKDTPKAVLQSTTLVFSMMSTPAAAREVFYGSDGVLAGVRKGTGLVDCATLEVKDMQEFAQAVEGKGGRFLEAPVSGSKVPAETGQLIFLAAGDEALYRQVSPKLLAAMGKASFYLGATGKGTEMKLVANMIMGSMLSSLSEGLVLTEKAGLKPEDLVSVLGLGAMANPMFNLKGPKMIVGDHVPNFPLKHAQKDLAFSLRLGEQLGVPLKVANAANDMYERALAQPGVGDLDFSAVIKALDKSK